MSSNENHTSPSNTSHKHGGLALHMGPHKKAPDSICTVQLSCTFDYGNTLTQRTRRTLPSKIIQRTCDWEHRVFLELVDSYPGLLDHLTNGKEDDIIHTGELISFPYQSVVILSIFQPVTGALLCPAGLDWSNGETKQSLKSSETAVHGDQWPMFLYAGYIYNSEDPWKGLLKSEILVFGFKHVFTCPSSVDKEPKATCSGNAYLHGMKSVTKGSLAYIAMQLQFLLSSSSVFSHTDMVTDSKNFYHSILDLLEDPDESEEVTDLMMW
ncbi:hypothetical protein EDD22DRAFT_846647 [Suillus occidentalis]|nr:hypothetical protein EDD22DRAFT_846647 [Suillus occidentalis]